jgi:hypothetical protein
MADLPPEFEAIAFLVESQPAEVRSAFNYCLGVMMVEACKMSLVEILPGESNPVHVFQTAFGETYSVEGTPMSDEVEAEMIRELRTIIEEEKQLQDR